MSRKPVKDKRLIRLLRLLKILQSGSGKNVAALAKACRVGPRTIFRDLRALRSVGVPIEFDSKAGRYFLVGESAMPPSEFTADEAVTIVALANEFGRKRELPFYDAAYDATRKLQPRFSVPLQRSVRQLVRAIRIRPTTLTKFEQKDAAFRLLLASIQKRRVVQIQYESLTEWETITTVLSPYHLLFCRHSWYVIGRSSMHREIRMFNVVRIKSFEMLKKRYVVPRKFDLERYFGNAWLMMRHSGRLHHVVIRFDQQMAKNVAEVQWHRTQRTRFLADGSLEFQVKVTDFAEIQWWVLGYGDQAEVLRPAKLRRIIAQRARKLAKMYRDDLEPEIIIPQRRFKAG
jgi:proteasome accessory factor B